MVGLFSSTTLVAAKNAGIPISVLVGIIAIFSLIVATKKADLRVFATIISFAFVCTLSLLYIFWVSTQEIYQWVDTKAEADWMGNDEGWTDTSVPEQQYCDRSREGNIATCWRNRPSGYPTDPPPMFKGKTESGAWCTYKLREASILTKSTGSDTGQVYICARVSL